jgi:hypothetical protein
VEDNLEWWIETGECYSELRMVTIRLPFVSGLALAYS